MTIYVDNMYIPAKVGRYQARWCHLLGDSPDMTELHEFAARIGLRRSWFQPDSTNWWCSHYDVTETVRAKAVAAGAVEVTFHQLCELLERFAEGRQ